MKLLFFITFICIFFFGCTQRLPNQISNKKNPEKFDSIEIATNWAKENISPSLHIAKVSSELSEAVVFWANSNTTDKQVKVLTICRKLNSNIWSFVYIESFDGLKFENIDFDNFGAIEYEKDQDYLGYYTKNNKFLLKGIAIDECSGAVPLK